MRTRVVLPWAAPPRAGETVVAIWERSPVAITTVSGEMTEFERAPLHTKAVWGVRSCSCALVCESTAR